MNFLSPAVYLSIAIVLEIILDALEGRERKRKKKKRRKNQLLE